MKRLTNKFVAVALVAFATALFVQVQASNNLVQANSVVTLLEDEVTWVKVELKDVPQAVTKAAAVKYEGSSIESAFKGSDNTYKLVVKTGDTNVTSIFDAEGNFVKQVLKQK